MSNNQSYFLRSLEIKRLPFKNKPFFDYNQNSQTQRKPTFSLPDNKSLFLDQNLSDSKNISSNKTLTYKFKSILKQLGSKKDSTYAYSYSNNSSKLTSPLNISPILQQLGSQQNLNLTKSNNSTINQLLNALIPQNDIDFQKFLDGYVEPRFEQQNETLYSINQRLLDVLKKVDSIVLNQRQSQSITINQSQIQSYLNRRPHSIASQSTQFYSYLR